MDRKNGITFSRDKFNKGSTYQTYPVKLQVCLDVNLYNKIQNRMIEEKNHNISEFVRKLLRERFNIENILEGEKESAVKSLTGVIMKRESQLNQKITIIVDLEQKIKQMEKQIRILNKKVK